MDWVIESEWERRYGAGWVYFIKEADSCYVKIGCTGRASPITRFVDLAQANPRKLELIGLVPCGGKGDMLDMETRFHRAFAKYRVHREWYGLPAAEIKRIRQRYGQPVTSDMALRIDRYYKNKGGLAHLLVPERIDLIEWEPDDNDGDRLDHVAAVLGLPEETDYLEF